jgi:hypothetical protein
MIFWGWILCNDGSVQFYWSDLTIAYGEFGRICRSAGDNFAI